MQHKPGPQLFCFLILLNFNLRQSELFFSCITPSPLPTAPPPPANNTDTFIGRTRGLLIGMSGQQAFKIRILFIYIVELNIYNVIHTEY